ncbi:MAG: TolC family protein [Chitinophagaceae bacterium]|nr:MAG: TolC family protein [Chitinophagaceae bacterium]
MTRTVFLLALLLQAIAGKAQSVFTEAELLAVVRRYHPAALSATLDPAIARSRQLAARGAFDPLLRYNSGVKELEGIRYYNESAAELKIPTWYGVDLYAGTERITGERLNPEETRGTLSYAGVSVPLASGLLFDKRRAALQQAAVLVNASEAARRSALNNLLQEVLDDYWQWWEAERRLVLADSALANAERRLQLVRAAWRLGDRAAIDTLEALVQVQAFTLERSEAALSRTKARLELSQHLWREDRSAYDLPENIRPQEPPRPAAPLLDELLGALPRHPDLQQYFYKQDAARIDRRLKFHSLLPDVDVKYQALTKSSNPLKGLPATPFRNDYRFGISAALPLRLSEGRGEWRAAKQKLLQAELQATGKRVELQTKARKAFAEWQQLTGQLKVQQGAAESYERLLRGEEARFRNGESALFVVNAREQKWWEARQKGIQIEAKLQRARVQLQWTAGLLGGNENER